MAVASLARYRTRLTGRLVRRPSPWRHGPRGPRRTARGQRRQVAAGSLLRCCWLTVIDIDVRHPGRADHGARRRSRSPRGSRRVVRTACRAGSERAIRTCVAAVQRSRDAPGTGPRGEAGPSRRARHLDVERPEHPSVREGGCPGSDATRTVTARARADKHVRKGDIALGNDINTVRQRRDVERPTRAARRTLRGASGSRLPCR